MSLSVALGLSAMDTANQWMDLGNLFQPSPHIYAKSNAANSMYPERNLHAEGYNHRRITKQSYFSDDYGGGYNQRKSDYNNQSQYYNNSTSNNNAQYYNNNARNEDYSLFAPSSTAVQRNSSNKDIDSFIKDFFYANQFNHNNSKSCFSSSASDSALSSGNNSYFKDDNSSVASCNKADDVNVKDTSFNLNQSDANGYSSDTASNVSLGSQDIAQANVITHLREQQLDHNSFDELAKISKPNGAKINTNDNSNANNRDGGDGYSDLNGSRSFRDEPSSGRDQGNNGNGNQDDDQNNSNEPRDEIEYCGRDLLDLGDNLKYDLNPTYAELDFNTYFENRSQHSRLERSSMMYYKIEICPECEFIKYNFD